ncbi:MAG: pyridoxal-phosphate dependent enzyme [Lachnospiraceae bacterium]|nr:pyridoxal-phosphate dependent enzyme [Lachnospiraceae bacterium]
MAKVHDSVLELAGGTPLLRLHHIENKAGVKAEIVAKLEFVNPSRSVKDRIAGGVIEEAEQSGSLKPGAAVIAAADGNTGIALALAAAAKGHPLTLVMPSSTRIEIRKLAGGYGAKTVIVPGGAEGAQAKAKALAKQSSDAFLLEQVGRQADSETAGIEIWRDTDGRADFLVADESAWGTLVNAGSYLKGKNPEFKIVAAVSETCTQGQIDSIDEAFTITEEEARRTTAVLAGSEGILTGISSGAAVAAALHIADRKENAGKRIIVILADTGERYLSTEVFGAVLTPPDPF